MRRKEKVHMNCQVTAIKVFFKDQNKNWIIQISNAMTHR